MTCWVYILASRRNGALYFGTTCDLARRLREHRRGKAAANTRELGATRLVYAQALDGAERAAAQKRRLEKWPRAWTLRLIDLHNPGWRDLCPGQISARDADAPAAAKGAEKDPWP